MIKRLILILVVIGGGLGCVASPPADAFKIGKPAVRQWNHLVFPFVANGVNGKCDLWYHPSRIHLGPEATTRDSVIVFEGGYSIGGQNLPDKVLLYRSPPNEISMISGFGKRWGPGKWRYGKLNRCVYRIETEENLGGVVEQLEGLFFSNALLDSIFIPRVEVHQYFRGDWRLLSRFAVPDFGMAFHLAPEDTIRLRISTAVMAARYYPDRVIAQKARSEELSGLSLKIVKAPNGYWPVLAKRGFFQGFTDTTLYPGESFEYSYAAVPSGLYTLGINVWREGEPMAMGQTLVFMGPDLYVNDVCPPNISSWPLVPTPEQVLNEQDPVDLGYPGGKIYPRWAVEMGLEMGSGFSNYDRNNYEAHKDLIDAWNKRLEESRD